MPRNAVVWTLMVSAVAVHVADEALTGFLPFYNEQVLTLRERFAFFPAPTFSFSVWLGGLAVAVAAGVAMIPAIARGSRVVRATCGVLSVLMIANACGHLLGSVYAGRLLPGFWSAPWLLAMSVWMLRRVINGDWRRRTDMARER